MERVKKAVIYTRVSTGEQAESGTSLEAQEIACYRKAAEMGAQVVEAFSDPGVSGALYLGRPGIQAALQALESGQADTLIIYKLDRTGRDVDVIRDIRKRIENAGGQLVFADGMNFANNAVGKLMFTQMAGFAEFEKESIRERTTGGRQRRAEQGLQPCRTISPYGYHVVTKPDVLSGAYPAEQLGTYQIVEDKAKWAKEIYARYFSGASIRQIRKWLASEGVPSPEGCPRWSVNTLNRLLSHPAYKGTPVFGRTRRKVDETRLANGRKRIDYAERRDESEWVYLTCEPIVSEEVWQECQRRLQANKDKRGNPRQKYLLTGVIICPHCKRRLSGMRQGNSKYYRCPHDRGCPYTNIHAGRLDTAYTQALMELSHRRELTEKAGRAFNLTHTQNYDPKEQKQLQQELLGLEKQEEATAWAQVDAMTQGRSTKVYDTLLAEIEAKRKTLQTRLAAIEAQRVVIEPRTATEKLASVLDDVKTVLTATEDEFSDGEKNNIIRQITMAIEPDKDKPLYYATFQPIPGLSSNVTRILMRVRVSILVTATTVEVQVGKEYGI